MKTVCPLGMWVRIPSSPPKNRYLDTKHIKVTVLFSIRQICGMICPRRMYLILYQCFKKCKIGFNPPLSHQSLLFCYTVLTEKGGWSMLNHYKKRAALFLASQGITLFGSSLVQFAVIWYVTMQTSSGVWVSAMTVAAYLPQFIVSFFLPHIHFQ